VLGVGLLDDPIAQARALERVDHRPWPVASAAWRVGQTWRHVLFAHWQVPVGALVRELPHGLQLDTHDAHAWLTVTCCELTGLRLRGMFPLPYLSSFAEVAVRTYVVRDGKPGIWFLSMDTASRAARAGGRRLYHLPMHHALATIDCAPSGEVVFTSERLETESLDRAAARYRASIPGEAAVEPQPGSLEYFLTERYCLYSVDDHGVLCRADIHHAPWQLHAASGDLAIDGMTPRGIDLSHGSGGLPLLHVAERQDALVWPLRRLTSQLTRQRAPVAVAVGARKGKRIAHAAP
jgi:uncharacterized protein YqjF (DUF2071 family)